MKTDMSIWHKNTIMKSLNQNKMKGYLHKTEREWIVVYDTNDGIDSFLLLHPHNIATSSFSFYNGKQVDFEIIKEKFDGNNTMTYAELVIDENGKPITYWGGLADEAFEKENEINKLAEEVYGKGVNYDYEEGYVDGYNKAKETLYTEEQVKEIIKDCFTAAEISARFAIKSLDDLKNKNHE